jgi:hypothetical protein
MGQNSLWCITLSILFTGLPGLANTADRTLCLSNNQPFPFTKQNFQTFLVDTSLTEKVGLKRLFLFNARSLKCHLVSIKK